MRSLPVNYAPLKNRGGDIIARIFNINRPSEPHKAWTETNKLFDKIIETKELKGYIDKSVDEITKNHNFFVNKINELEKQLEKFRNNKTGRKSKLDYRQIKELKQSGKSNRKVAEMLGVSEGAIRNCLKRGDKNE